MSIRDAVPASQYLDLLRAADVLLVDEHPRLKMKVLPSELASYYASGRPVLAATAADSTTATEVELSWAGVRVDPADPAAMVEAVQQLIAEPMRMKRMAENGRRHRAEHLTQDAAVHSFAALLDRITDRSNGHAPPRSPGRTGAMSSLTPRLGHQRAGGPGLYAARSGVVMTHATARWKARAEGASRPRPRSRSRRSRMRFRAVFCRARDPVTGTFEEAPEFAVHF